MDLNYLVVEEKEMCITKITKQKVKSVYVRQTIFALFLISFLFLFEFICLNRLSNGKMDHTIKNQYVFVFVFVPFSILLLAFT